MMRIRIAALFTSVVLVVSGCGGSSTGTGSTQPQPVAPTVTSVTPANATSGVAVNSTVTATFSEAMSAATLSTGTFSVTPAGGAAVSGSAIYNSGTMTATFTPSAALAYGTTYTATITSSAMSTSNLGLTSNYAWSFTTGAAPANLATVDFGTTAQTIRGFGGSTAWLGTLTTQQATALFSPTSGLGLSVLRVRIDPTGSAPTWVPSSGAWMQEVTNANEAVAANPNAIVFASPWTPPPTWKTSSVSQPYYSGTAACSPSAGYCGGYLDPSHYGDYAAYIEDFVSYFNSNSTKNLYAISMQNEPDWSAQSTENYESCSWTAAQMDSWVAANASVLTTKLIMPESLNFNTAQAATALSDTNAASEISIIAGHLYGASPSYQTQAETAGKDVWMTEHYISPTGSTPVITDALTTALEVHNAMVTGQYNAYVWWWIWDDPSDGINYGLINNSTTNPAPTYDGYAIGQFSKFIQPGYQRVSATATPVSGVYLSAYKGTGTYKYVLVVINSSSSAVSQSFSIANGSVTSLTPYETTSGGGLMAQSAVSVTDGLFTYTLPAQSITTFVQ